jgi:4-hydroxybenzoate polyprenyltransferase
LFQKVAEAYRNFNELIMFQHSIFSFPFIFIAMVISANGWFGWKLLILGVLAGLTARNFAMAFNRYLDIDHDSLNPRTKNRPSVDGRISKSGILSFTIANGIGFIIVAYFVNSLAFQLSIPILFILGIYSYFKRFSYFAHIILGISLGLAPISGVVAVEEAIPLWSIFLSIGVLFWVAGFDLLYSLQDIDFDKKFGLHSIPSRFGEKRTMQISAIFHILTVGFWYLAITEAELGNISLLAVFISALFLGYEHYLVRKDFRKIDRAFFTVNGYLGIMFFILIVLEKVV